MTAAEDKNPWLRLARISRDHAENKRLWNGYQKYLLRPDIDEYQRQMENPKFADIEDLSDAEIHNIQTEIPDLPKELEKRGEIALTEGLTKIKTPLELDGFYFAFGVAIENTTFQSVLTLNHAQFATSLYADDCIFKEDLYAQGANFGPFTTFSMCRFIGTTRFSGAKFEDAYFDQSNFEDYCDFTNADFDGETYFIDCIFTDSVTFSNAKFHGGSDFRLTAASSAAVPISFYATKFCRHPPHFFGRKMHEDTDWTDVKLPNARSKTAQCECLRENDKCADDVDQMADKPMDPKVQATLLRQILVEDKRAYEQLRIKCGALGKVEDEHLFFRKEMELTGRLSPWYTRATYRLYHLVSDYGYRYWRPIAGMGWLWVLWSVFYALHFMARDQLHLCMDGVELLLRTMGLSFANIFAVFGFYRRFPSDLLADPTFMTVLLTVSETLLGFVFLFFLGLGLRTRFRLR